MPQKRRKSIYKKAYAALALILLLFFANHIFTYVYLDVLHIEQFFTIKLFGMKHTFYVKDLFPYYSAPSKEHQMDIQIYLMRLCNKIREFLWVLLLCEVLKVLNFFLSQLPGRNCNNLIWIMYCFLGLCAYEVLDFIVFAGQTNYIYQSFIFIFIVSYVALTVKDKNA